MLSDQVLPRIRLTPHFFQGLLISVSGMDGSGKSTLCGLLDECLTERGHHVVHSRQPSGLLRNWSTFRAALSADAKPPFDLRTISGLVSWDRLAIQLSEVRPALERGYAVVCERYVPDICVFGTHRGAPAQWLVDWTAPLLEPDIAFITDAPAEEIRRRLMTRMPTSKRDEDGIAVDQLSASYRAAADRYDCILINTTAGISAARKQVKAALAQLCRDNDRLTHPLAQGVEPELAVLVGSDSDKPVLEESGLLGLLNDMELRYEFAVISSDRDPEELRTFCLSRRRRLRVVIAGARGVPNLPVTVKSWLPRAVVIGVPLESDPALALASLTTPSDRPVIVSGWGTSGLRKAAHIARDIL